MIETAIDNIKSVVIGVTIALSLYAIGMTEFSKEWWVAIVVLNIIVSL